MAAITSGIREKVGRKATVAVTPPERRGLTRAAFQLWRAALFELNTESDMASDTTRRIFARIFESERFGQILATADQDDEGHPCLRITCDTHPDALNPTTVTLSFGEDSDQFDKLRALSSEQAEAFAQGIFKQADKFAGHLGS